MAMIDKAALLKRLQAFNAELAAEGKTLQELEHDQKTEALGNMQKLHNDETFAKNRADVNA